MSYVLVDVNVLASRQLPKTLQAVSRKVQVEGTTELTRANTAIPCIKVFSADAAALTVVRPGIGVLCSAPTSEEDEQRLASFIAAYVTSSADDRESFLEEWSVRKLNIARWGACKTNQNRRNPPIFTYVTLRRFMLSFRLRDGVAANI